MVYVSYADYLSTRTWKVRALEAKDRAGWKCQNPGCGSDGPLEVHHLTYARVGREWDEDLVVLCEDCHAVAHDRLIALRPQMRLPFDVN